MKSIFRAAMSIGFGLVLISPLAPAGEWGLGAAIAYYQPPLNGVESELIDVPGLRQPVIFTRPVLDVDKDTSIDLDTGNKYKTSSLDANMSAVLRVELLHHMETKSPYLDSKLTLSQLAKQLGISSNYLSQAINEQFDKNFFDFINDYRVEEAKRLPIRPKLT